ncbi:MAG: glycosyltransferase family 4 protein [Chloroflexi bacterium]|nr:glycosyltransferase family 4 protein [Chloroflexota bacterium]
MNTNQALRVAMIIQGYHPLVGGAERQLAAVAPLLQARGVDVHILTRRYPGLAAFEMIGGVPVHRLPIPGPKAVASAVFTLAALPLLWRLRPHVIHAYSLFSPATTAVTAKRLLGAPVVVKVLRGGALGDVIRLQQKSSGEGRMALFRKQVDAFVVISQEIDAELAAAGVPPERRVFLPNGVDIGHFAPADKQALRSKLGLPGAPIVVFAGRLAAEKRVDQLLALWPAARAAHAGATLLIIGTGEQELALKRAAGEGVQFVGQVDDVAPYLKAADLFVLPSSTEGLSNAMLEAMATGLPVVATSVGGTTDLITPGENGLLVPPDSPPALQEALLTLLADEARRTEMGRRGREQVLGDYALPAVAGRLRNLYNQLAATQPASRVLNSV